MCDNPDENYTVEHNEKKKKKISAKKKNKEKYKQIRYDENGKKLCKKCDNIATIQFRKDAVCRNCFIENIDTKFSTSLGKMRKTQTKRNRNNVKLVIGFSGGPSSRCLLDLISKHTLQRREYNSIKLFDITVVHVDYSILLPGYTEELRDKRLNYIREVYELYSDIFNGLEIIPIQSLYGDPELLENSEKIQTLIKDLRKSTSKEDMVIYFVNNILRQYAYQVEAKYVVFGDTATKLSVQVISSTSKGRGFAIPLEIKLISPPTLKYQTTKSQGPTVNSFVLNAQNEESSNNNNNNDNNNDIDTEEEVINNKYMNMFDKNAKLYVGVFKPLRDLLAKDIGLYNRFEDVDVKIENPHFFSSFDTMLQNKTDSINHLSELFITSLQSEYSHTIHTILRTADKLSMPKDFKVDENVDICSLCGYPLTKEEIGLVNKFVHSSCKNNDKKKEDDIICSEESCCKVNTNNNNDDNDNGCCESQKEITEEEDFKCFVCYGCKRILEDKAPKKPFNEFQVNLPPYVHQNANESATQSRLRNEISEFLLDDEDENDD